MIWTQEPSPKEMRVNKRACYQILYLDLGKCLQLRPSTYSLSVLLTRTRLDRYAKAEYLSNYIPELDPTNDRAITLRVKMAKRATMLKLQMGIATLIVCINIGIAIWAFVRFPPDHRDRKSVV